MLNLLFRILLIPFVVVFVVSVAGMFFLFWLMGTPITVHGLGTIRRFTFTPERKF